MRLSCVLFSGVLCVVFSSVLGSYEGGYGAAHDDHDDYYEPSYPAPPIVHPHHGHSAGSYYHYHVPLVGQQQQHYQPYHQHHDHSHYLWPLLLLLALPLLFLPLLPLLLLPLGISLLALLAPGGMMMMMMMMMMMGGGMMMRTDTISGRAFNEMRTFGEVIFSDMTSLLTKYARSLDLDQCPQRVACEMGAIFFHDTNGTDSSTAKAFTSFLMEQYIPKGRFRKTIKQFEKAFWTGSKSIESCSAFPCQPSFRVYKDTALDPDKLHESGSAAATISTSSSSVYISSSPHLHESRIKTANEDQLGDLNQTYGKNVNFVYSTSSKANAIDDSNHSNSNSIDGDWKSLTSTERPASLKRKRSHIYSFSRPENQYDVVSKSKAESKSKVFPHSNKNTYFKMFGTPTVQS